MGISKKRWDEAIRRELLFKPNSSIYRIGDRIRYATIGEDGLPLVRYGFIGGVTGGDGPIVVMLDGELGGDVVDPADVEPVHICNVTLTLDGSDLLDDPSLLAVSTDGSVGDTSAALPTRRRWSRRWPR